MNEDNNQSTSASQPETLTFTSLGGLENVTRNMYVYEYKNQMLIVDCGLGFPDESMLGVDLLLPDITYLLEGLKSGKKIVGMILTHGHEDHIGGLPFILPQLMRQGEKRPSFPIYASPLTTALSNEKLTEFNLPAMVEMVNFTDKDVKMGDFTVSFIHVTHSVPDSANFFIRTPVGNFFHGSDYKFDYTPANGKRTEFLKIMKAAEEGVLCLMSDCLGSDRRGHTGTEKHLGETFEREMRECRGKFIVTTYSSNISRLNQIIEASESTGRRVCFVGRSVVKVKQIAERLGYLKIKSGTEIKVEDAANYKDHELTLVVAGSQGQENSAMTRIAEGQHKEIKLSANDFVVFSSDTIPGNEMAVNALYDTISKVGARVLASEGTGAYHVSGHGSTGEHQLLIALTQPKYLLPISGTFRHMVAYRQIAEEMGYKRNDIYLVENGQQIIFTSQSAKFGKKLEIKNVFVDEVSGEEVESFVVRDRERLSKEGIIIVMAEIKTNDGQLAAMPDIIARGSSLTDVKNISGDLQNEISKGLSHHQGKVTNWVHTRKMIGDLAARYLYKKFRTRPLVIPVVIEV